MRRILLLLACAAVCMAGSWDGIHGPLTVATIWVPGCIPYVPCIPNNPERTWLWVRTTDPTITAVRATVTMVDGTVHAYVADLPAISNYGGWVYVATNPREVASVKLTALRDAGEY